MTIRREAEDVRRRRHEAPQRPDGAIHGTVGGDNALCDKPMRELSAYLPLVADYRGPLRERETWTTLLENITCKPCIRVRDADEYRDALKESRAQQAAADRRLLDDLSDAQEQGTLVTHEHGQPTTCSLGLGHQGLCAPPAPGQ